MLGSSFFCNLNTILSHYLMDNSSSLPAGTQLSSTYVASVSLAREHRCSGRKGHDALIILRRLVSGMAFIHFIGDPAVTNYC